MKILLASDFSGLAASYLFEWAMLAIGCLVAGLIIAGALATVTKTPKFWFTAPFIGALAFALWWLATGGRW